MAWRIFYYLTFSQLKKLNSYLGRTRKLMGIVGWQYRHCRIWCSCTYLASQKMGCSQRKWHNGNPITYNNILENVFINQIIQVLVTSMNNWTLLRSLLVVQNHKIVPLISRIVLKFSASGLISKFKNDNFPTVKKCRVDADQDTTVKPLRIKELQVTFFLLGIGLSFSIFAFLCELVSFKLKRKNKTSPGFQVSRPLGNRCI